MGRTAMPSQSIANFFRSGNSSQNMNIETLPDNVLVNEEQQAAARVVVVITQIQSLPCIHCTLSSGVHFLVIWCTLSKSV